MMPCIANARACRHASSAIALSARAWHHRLLAPYRGQNSPMLSYRLRWYALETGRLLRRRWQALVLALLLLSPMAMPVFAQTRLLGSPVMAPLMSEHGILWRYACLHLLEGVAILWLLIQRQAVAGGPFAAYLRALPISRRRSRMHDLTVLMLANSPILLPLCAAAVAYAALPQRVSHYFYLADLLLITLAAQVLILARSRHHVPLYLLANLCLVVALQAPPIMQALGFCAAAVFAALVMLLAPETALAPSTRYRSTGAWRPAWPVPLRISIAAVARIYRVRWLTRAALMGACLVGGFALMGIWQYDGRAAGLMLLLQATCALIAAGGYRDLGDAHRQAQAYTRALPLGRQRFALWDTMLVLAGSLPFCAALPLGLLLHHALAPGAAVADILACVPLLLLLRIPHRLNQAVVVSILLATGWTGAAWSLLL